MSKCNSISERAYHDESDYELLGSGLFGVGTKLQKTGNAHAHTTDKAKVNEAMRKAKEDRQCSDLNDLLSEVLIKPVETESQALEVGIANS